MTGYKDLITGIGHYHLLPLFDTSAPDVPEASPIQTTLPTSAYGQTIPVVWGKCRLPAAYIWVPPILTVTSSHTEWWDTITSTTSDMSCRLRFARPLVPNSTWTLRKLYSNGTLIYDATQSYRAKGLKFRAYDGRSTQGRDPTMVSEEGATNVSAHRGYLDVVVTDFDIQGLGAPPVFEAEWIQDSASTHDYDSFQTYSGSIYFNKLLPVWDQSKLYGFQQVAEVSQLYSIPAIRQYFSFEMGASEQGAYFQSYRYSKTLDRLVMFTSGFDIDYNPRSYDGATGELKTVGGDTCKRSNGCCLVELGQTAFVVMFTADARVYCYRLIVDTVTGDQFNATADTGANWLGYAAMQCVTPGEVRGGEFDVYFCADGDLVKATFFSTGLLKSSSVLASFSDDLRYVVYDDGDLVVWTDAATVSRVVGTTGSIAYTKSVPYQIDASSGDIAGTRDIADPDLHRFTEDLYFGAGSNSYFTDLGSGTTRTVTGRRPLNTVYCYDGQTNTVYTKDNLDQPLRIRFIADGGDMRLLSDFLQDLMVYGGDFDPADIVTENIDDAIQAAVIDLTAGTRDIARAVIEPYSIAMFER